MMNKIFPLYVHIPFCDHICSYCDFYKMIAKEELYISKEKANEEYDKFFMKNAMGYVPNMFY